MPDVFLSYSRDDSVFMQTLLNNLRALGFNVWIDEELLTVGTPEWETAIEKAVERVDALVVILSPNAKASKWVNIELRLADLHETRVFPVLAAGDQRTAVPARLLGMQYADMRGRADYEAGFHQLVNGLAAHTSMTVSAFSMDFSGEPRVQINVYGQTEGNIVAIGGDVAGDLNVAGRDIVQSVGQRTPASRSAPSPSSKSSQVADEMAFVHRWWQLGAGLLVAIVTLLYLVITSLAVSLSTLGVVALVAALTARDVRQRRWLSAGIYLLPLLAWVLTWGVWLESGNNILYVREYTQPVSVGFVAVTSWLAAYWLIKDALSNKAV
jgi:hypothetical protein